MDEMVILCLERNVGDPKAHLQYLNPPNFAQINNILSELGINKSVFKNLGVDMNEVAPTSLLKDRKREIDGNPDFNKDLGVTHISPLLSLLSTTSADVSVIPKLSGPSIGQSALQLSLPIQIQEKNEVHIDDRSKVPSVLSNEAKPLLPSLSTTSADVSVIPKAPPSDVQDKVYFIINNIFAKNIESKGKEFAEVLPEQYYPWFAHYMVMKRARIEPHFHDLYLKFLEKVDSEMLFEEILKNTYENCKVLLGSELIKSSPGERSVLKNLGSWLGKLTIGRSCVLNAREIDPESLIVKAYEKGSMIAVIPFTSKVLETWQNSSAYRPPNPWMMAILGLLAEIHSMPNLKLNLMFEIEALFKNLGVDMNKVARTSLLKDRKREIDGNPDFRNIDLGATHISQPQMISEPKTISSLKQIDLPLDVANSPNTELPSKLLSQVYTLFESWYQICELPGANETACSQYVLHLHQTGLLKGDDTRESFFRTLLEFSVAHCILTEDISSGSVQSPQQAQSPSFFAIDLYAKLVFSILKYFPEQESSSKLFLLSEIMAVTVRCIQKDAEDKKKSLNPKPYFRLFINWLLDLCSLDPGTDGANFQVLTAFANTFHALQPLKIPAFGFAWLELVSHESFIPKLLTVDGQKGWPYVQSLLVDLLQFLEPFLRKAEPGGSAYFLKGTLSVLLVLRHDFPEFLCDYHFTFCDFIPSSCIEMRNIILSSFPRNMRLPDPSTPNLKIGFLPEIVKAPCILSKVDAALEVKQMKNDVDEYLMSRQQNTTFLSELKQKLLLSSNEASSAGTRYSVPLINSLVLYIGMQAIQQLQAGETQAQNVVALQMFKYLSIELDMEGRYLFLNAIANQLRYPNNHTHYFSLIMLHLFFTSDQGIIEEQITRVLLKRLIVNRPHPWGLLITFIELIKNPKSSAKIGNYNWAI